MPKLVWIYVILLLTASSSAKAQVTIDVSKLTCHQFATYKVASPNDIAIWLNGYFHGKRGDVSVDTQELVGKTNKLTEYCIKNPDAIVMEAVETLFGSQN